MGWMRPGLRSWGCPVSCRKGVCWWCLPTICPSPSLSLLVSLLTTSSTPLQVEISSSSNWKSRCGCNNKIDKCCIVIEFDDFGLDWSGASSVVHGQGRIWVRKSGREGQRSGDFDVFDLTCNTIAL